MNLSQYRQLLFMTLFFGITVVSYLVLMNSKYWTDVLEFAKDKFLFYFTTLVFIKALGIVYPPIPGGILTFGSIPVIGMWWAYLADFIGSFLGSIIAYFLGRRFGYSILNNLFDQATIEKIKQIKVVKKREIESVFMLRIFGGSLLELVCYGAGLLKIGFWNFLIGSILSHIAIVLPTYYFLTSIFGFRNILMNLTLAAIAVFLFYKLKGRYLE